MWTASWEWAQRLLPRCSCEVSRVVRCWEDWNAILCLTLALALSLPANTLPLVTTRPFVSKHTNKHAPSGFPAFLALWLNSFSAVSADPSLRIKVSLLSLIRNAAYFRSDLKMPLKSKWAFQSFGYHSFSFINTNMMVYPEQMQQNSFADHLNLSL